MQARERAPVVDGRQGVGQPVVFLLEMGLGEIGLVIRPGDALLIDELFLGDGDPAFRKDSKDDGDGLLLDECIFDDGEALLPDVLRPDVLFLGEGEEVLLDNPLSID